MSAENKKIVVVDDDPMIRFLVSEFLKAHGYDVTSLENGQACLDHLEQNSTDLLIVDLQMPEMSGIEVLKAIRSSTTRQPPPVMMLTANIRDGQTDPEAIATLYVEKPFDMNKFLSSVESLVK